MGQLVQKAAYCFGDPIEMPDKELNTDPADFLELSQELLDRGALLRFQAHGSSMYPFIKNGDIIIVEPRDSSSLNTGDIVFYRRPDGSTTAHRLVDIKDRGGNMVLITKGDAMKYIDPPVKFKQVMGRVIIIEGQGRKLRLNGWPGRFFGWVTAWLARGRYPNQRRVVRYIDRLGWLCGGRRVK
jgi:signal peptidase